MGLWDKLKGELIEVIEWTDNSNGETISYRFDHRDNSIKNGAKLTVRGSQVAVFVHEGEFADVFKPGMYELKTENIPLLTMLKSWKYGFNSPFKSEVYFVNTGLIEELKWGTPGPVGFQHDEFDEVRVTLNGTISFEVDTRTGADGRSNLYKFMEHVVKTDNQFMKDELKGRIRDIVVRNLPTVLKNLSSRSLVVDYNEIGDLIKEKLNPEFEKRGMILDGFNVLQFEYDEATKAAIDEGKKRAGEMRGVKKMGTAQNIQMSNAMKMGDAIQGSGENGGNSMMANMMGAGLGFNLGNQMANQMNPQNNMNNGGNQMPPPVPPALKFYIAVNGAQTGPYEMPQLQQMAQSGQLKKEMMVWKEGMPAWAAAGTVPELSPVFSMVPPPLPPQ